MQVQEEPQRLAVQLEDLHPEPLEAQPPDQGHDRAYAMAIHEMDAGEVENDILIGIREPIDVRPDITDEGCVGVSV
jgi:hypothetical protein